MRTLVIVCLLLGVICSGSVRVHGQDATTPRSASDNEAARRAIREVADTLRHADRSDDVAVVSAWRLSKTPWGDPDIEGVYTNSDEHGIPFERPAEFDGRKLEDITTEELLRLRDVRREAKVGQATSALEGTVGWMEAWNAKNSRAWLVVDPRDGHIAPLTPSGQRRADAAAEARSRPRAADSYADRSLYARCISRGMPGSMTPEFYGNAYQIHQAPGFVAIRHEVIHETRVIPLDGRAHIDSAIRSYMGDARGRWEGNVLVVESRNFKAVTDGSGAVRNAFRGADPATLRLVERFTPKGLSTIEWAVTVDDSTTWTAPWTFAMKLTKTDETQQPYEYACHEGNYGLRNILQTERNLENRQVK